MHASESMRTESVQPLSADDVGLLDQVLRFSSRYAWRYTALAAPSLGMGIAMLVLAGPMMRRVDAVASVIPAVIAGAALLWIGWKTARVARFHFANRRGLQEDRRLGSKRVVSGVLRSAPGSSEAMVYAFVDGPLVLAHPMMLQGYRLQYCAMLGGAVVEVHFCQRTRMLLGARYPAVAANVEQEAVLDSAQIVAFSSAGLPAPAMQRTTRGTVTEVIEFVHPLPWPAGSTLHRNVRLKDDEFGDTNAAQQPGEEATITVYG